MGGSNLRGVLIFLWLLGNLKFLNWGYVMRILFYLIIITVITGCTFKEPSNFAECILENMPGVSNESARSAVHRQCKKQYPNKLKEIKQGSGLGFNSTFKSRDECVIEKNRNTLNKNAAININLACYCLYEKPTFKNQLCEYEQPNYSELIEVK